MVASRDPPQLRFILVLPVSEQQDLKLRCDEEKQAHPQQFCAVICVPVHQFLASAAMDQSVYVRLSKWNCIKRKNQISSV